MSPFREKAIAILRANDRGGYTVPTSSGLYPAQWNWDSCLVALGFADFRRAARVDGDRDAVRRPMARRHGSAHSVSRRGFQLFPQRRGLVGGARQTIFGDHAAARRGDGGAPSLRAIRRRAQRARMSRLWRQSFWPGTDGFIRARDPEGTGLVSIIHPWESGMDNSPVWDAALAAVEPGPSVAHLRRDTTFADVSVRPTTAEYDRYMNLVLKFRAEGYRADRLYGLAPFRVADVGFNAILLRANRDLRFLLEATGDSAGVAEVEAMIAKSSAALEARWDAADGFYYSLDTRSGATVRKPGIGGLLPLYAGADVAARHPAMVERLERWLAAVDIGVPSFEPGRPEFEPRRYWRGPVWLVVNWMLIDGLRQNGRPDLASRILGDSFRCVETSGFREYFDPLTGEGLGGTEFSWTAAMVLVFEELRGRRQA